MQLFLSFCKSFLFSVASFSFPVEKNFQFFFYFNFSLLLSSLSIQICSSTSLFFGLFLFMFISQIFLFFGFVCFCTDDLEHSALCSSTAGLATADSSGFYSSIWSNDDCSGLSLFSLVSFDGGSDILMVDYGWINFLQQN